jgi:hypothetical protein
VKTYGFFPNLSSKDSKRGGKSPQDALRRVSFNDPMHSAVPASGDTRVVST